MQIVEKAQMVCGLWNSAAAPWIDWLYKEPGLFQPFRVLVLLLSFAPLLLSEHSRLYIWGGGGVWISLANCYHVSVVQLFVYYVIYVLRLVLWSVALNWTQGKKIDYPACPWNNHHWRCYFSCACVASRSIEKLVMSDLANCIPTASCFYVQFKGAKTHRNS